MRPVKLQSVADAELAEATEWYLTRSPAAAHRFVESVEWVFEQIAHHPEAAPLVQGQLRRSLIPHFPYAVYYRVFPDVISVVGVVHARRHPRRWRARG